MTQPTNSIAKARLPMLIAALLGAALLLALPYWQKHVFSSGQLDAAKSLHAKP